MFRAADPAVCKHSALSGTIALILTLGGQSNRASLSCFCLPSAFLVFLVMLLFWAMLVVVLLVDLSLGGYRQ